LTVVAGVTASLSWQEVQMQRAVSIVLAGFAFLVAASGIASAAPAAPSTWTGCYLGANVGYGWAPANWSDNALQFAAHSANGVVGGGQIGCDYQSGP
jgi:outer membrane immunogenic protein